MKLQEMIILNPKGKCLARPGISLTLYCDVTLHNMAPQVANVLNMYLTQIGNTTLKTYFNADGEAKPLTQARLGRDMQQLQAVKDSTKAVIMEYSSDETGWVGEFGFSFFGADFSHYLYEGERANYLRLDFPFDYLEQVGVDGFLTFVAQVLPLVPVNFANAGFTFQRSSATQADSTRAVNRLLPRFLGFDAGYKDVMDDVRGHAYMAHWLNFLGPRLVEKLGGAQSVAQALPASRMTTLSHGLLICNCQYPPSGDVNRGALDLGQIPALARVLKPVRVSLPALGEPSSKFDGEAWMARFDSRNNGPWENEKAYRDAIADWKS